MKTSEHNREFWDSQYRFSKFIPGFEELHSEMDRRNDSVSASDKLSRFDTGAHPRQYVEVVERALMGSVLPVFVHGGFWSALTAEEHRFVLEGLLTHNGIVGNVEYRLMPEYGFDDLIADVKAGVELLWEEYHRPILLVGHSAGAHLALSAAMNISSMKLAGVVGLSGIYDLEPMQYCFLQDKLNFKQQQIELHSLTNSTEYPELPVLLGIGEDETAETYRQARFLQARMLGSEYGCNFHIDRGTNHISILFSLSEPDSHIQQVIGEFLDAQKSVNSEYK